MKKKYGKIISLIFMILFFISLQTIVYSAFSSTMNLTGTAHARIEKDVRITDFKLISTKGASSFYEQFSIDTLSAGISILSNESEREIIYEVEVTNYGSKDVGILNITGMPNTLSYELIDYKLQDKICDESNKCNNFAVKTFQIKITGNPGDYEFTLKFDFRTYHKVTYTDIENKGYPTDVIDGGDLNITFKEDLKKISVLSNETEIYYYKQISSNQTITIENVSDDIEIKKIKELVAKLVNGTITKVGSEVCIKDECFNIVSNDGSTISMLAKYNLYVGSSCTSSSCTAYSSESTGIQNSTMLGYNSSLSKYNGVVSFSSSTYWSNDTTSYPSYVYNSNSNIYNYVENYKLYLENEGAIIEKARLIKMEELEALGCNRSSNTCASALEWVYTTSFWSGDANAQSYIRAIKGKSSYSGYRYSTNNSFGVRPVIEIPIDEIYIPPVVTIVSGDTNTVGSEICIKNECFYLISSTKDTVTLLAKMNIKLDASPIQSASAGESYYSTKSTDYAGSIIEEYVNNYKTTLEGLGAEVQEARIITYEELNNPNTFACDFFQPCNENYPWIYATDYWTSSMSYDFGNITGMWYVSPWQYGIFDTSESGSDFTEVTHGVRPVITIPISEF